MDRKAVKILIKGRVQGVGYRAWAQKTASGLGLTGWVRNLPDGSVEAVVQGVVTTVDTFAAQCQSGPLLAKVDSVHMTSETWDEGFQQFEFRRGE